jgi:hypothetical protein
MAENDPELSVAATSEQTGFDRFSSTFSPPDSGKLNCFEDFFTDGYMIIAGG